MAGYSPTQVRTSPLNGLRTAGPLMRLGQNNNNNGNPPKNGGGDGNNGEGAGGCTCGCHPLWYLGTALGGALLLAVLFGR